MDIYSDSLFNLIIMEQNMDNTQLVSYCGLYCGKCKKYINGKCPGCQKNTKATWCKIRTCNIENDYASCAECKLDGIENCKKFNNPVSKLFAFVFNSDRPAAIQLIKDEGYNGFVNYMVETNKMTVPRRRK